MKPALGIHPGKSVLSYGMRKEGNGEGLSIFEGQVGDLPLWSRFRGTDSYERRKSRGDTEDERACLSR